VLLVEAASRSQWVIVHRTRLAGRHRVRPVVALRRKRPARGHRVLMAGRRMI